MAVWDDTKWLEGQPGYLLEYSSIWRSKRKIVFSRTLERCSTGLTEHRKEFAERELRALKRKTEGELSIGGAGIASAAFSMGLIDEIRLFVMPVLAGGGKRWIDGALAKRLRFVETRRFEQDVVMLRYRVEG